MSSKSLTIGFAVYDDPKGAAFTIQHIRLFHPEIHDKIEMVVVDNNPTSQGGARVRNMTENVKEFPCRYYEFPSPVGTSAPRQRVFEAAEADAVLCMDAHVMLPPGALAELIEYYQYNPKSRDLFSGPMIYDNLMPSMMATHFDNSWGGEMWGRWGTAWRNFDDTIFDICSTQDGKCVPRRLFDEFPLTPDKIEAEFPKWPWDLGHSGHQEHFENLGYRLAAGYTDDDPFEIMAMGLGLFTCRREAWLGFNPLFRGFGGEEHYIHEKFRQAGARAMCLPFLRWWHFFAYESPPYAKHLTHWNKIRNYVIGHAELGLPMDKLRAEFLDQRKIPQVEWDILMKDPKNPPEHPTEFRSPGNVLEVPAGDCRTCGQNQGVAIPPAKSLTVADTLDKIIKVISETKSDINEHVPKLVELASKCQHVAAVTSQIGPACIALLGGKPKRLLIHAMHNEQMLPMLRMWASPFQGEVLNEKRLDNIEETDMLFIDRIPNAIDVTAVLDKCAAKVRKWIVLAKTQVFGERDPQGGPGVLPALRKFVKENPKWTAIDHSENNNGLTVLSCQDADKPPLPSTSRQVWNFVGSRFRILMGKAKGHELLVSEEVAERRLDVCALCPMRNGDRCSKCGCFLVEIPEGFPDAGGAGKAMRSTESCPLAKWSDA